MKKALFVLMIVTIALTGFRKSDALIVSFNDDNSKAIDLSKKNTSTFSWSATNDTTKKGRRELGKEGNGGKGKKETSAPGTGGNGKGGNGGNAKKDADGNGGTKKDLWVKPEKKPQGNGGVGKDTAHNSDEKPFPLKHAAPPAPAAAKPGSGN